MIRLFIFDMGGVLARNFEVLPDAASALGMNEQALLAFIQRDIEPLMDGSMTSDVFWRRFTDRSGVAVRGDLLIELFNPNLDQDTIDLIRKLKGSYRVVCGTNTMAEHYDYHSSQGDYSVFDRVYASHLMGVAKPRPGFYNRILEQEGVRPEEAVFTDDLPENVEAARSLGIHSFLFTEADSLVRDMAAASLNIDPF